MPDLRITTLDGSSGSLAGDRLEAFKAGHRGPVLTPQSPGYDDVRVIWNGMMDKRPAIIARCEGTADVIATVNFARENGILLAVRGGGHNVAGTATCDGGLMLDLSLMKAVRVDAKSQTVRAQGGATLGDLDRETQVYGLAVPAGVISTTGIGGLTLGGGTGHQHRRRGLTIDNLLSVDIVNADGKARVASATENPDLFWAVRGGGGNFGVVTSFEYRAHPMPDQVYAFNPIYPIERSAEAIRAFRDFMRTAPEEFGGALLFWSVPAVPFIPQELHGRPIVVLFLVYTGRVEDGERLVEPLRALGTPLLDLTERCSWTALQSRIDPFVPKKALQYFWKSCYLSRDDDEVLDYLIEVAHTNPSKQTYLVLQCMGGAMSRVGATDTAFGPRDMPYMFEFDTMWIDPKDADKNIAWARQQWNDLQKYATGGQYLNLSILGEDGDETVRSALGSANYDRLAKVKAQYDPTNLFRLNHNVKPAR